MKSGLLAGILWALDTVILGIALTMHPFSSSRAVFLAPIISTFIHDLTSSFWVIIYMTITKKIGTVLKVFKTRSGKFIALGAIVGGPVGMLGYVIAISQIGPAYTAIISAVFPAVGAFLSYIFLKEKMKIYQIIALIIAIMGVVLLGYSPSNQEIGNSVLGFGAAIVCVIGWASEAVICAYGMKNNEVDNEQALQIRQIVSAIFYCFLIVPIVNGFGMFFTAITNVSFIVIAVAALFGTASYILYYKAIYQIGASKAMALNITYSAWAIVFTFIFFKESPSLAQIMYSLIVIIGSLCASIDFKNILNKASNKKTK